MLQSSDKMRRSHITFACKHDYTTFIDMMQHEVPGTTPLKATLFFTDHTQSVREGNVFSLSVHRGVCTMDLGSCPPPPQTWESTGDTPMRPGTGQAPPPPLNLGQDLEPDRVEPPRPPTRPGTGQGVPPHQNSVNGMVWAVPLWGSHWRCFLVTVIFLYALMSTLYKTI